MRSHTGATMSMGKGCAYSMSRRQQLNTRSSTEAELVGVNDAMGLILWTRLFLEAQGFIVSDNVVYQDNQSAILLENNGKMSSSKRTCHLEIRYFFVTDNVAKKHLRIEYCPTDDMVADFFTKPLQGTKFRRFQAMILNLPGADAVIPTSKECVETNDVGVTGEATFTTQDYLLQTYLDDELDTTTSASSWVQVVNRRRRRPVVKQSGAVLTLFTKRK
jgi:hypothetical protein